MIDNHPETSGGFAKGRYRDMLRSRIAGNAGLRILHLEDNCYDAALIAAALQVHLACQITAVATRVAFEAELERDTPDFIISDSSLPDFAGSLALAWAGQKCPGVPFVFCSGDVSALKQAEALKAGATGCISKDDLASLVALIRRLCGEAGRCSDATSTPN